MDFKNYIVFSDTNVIDCGINALHLTGGSAVLLKPNDGIHNESSTVYVRRDVTIGRDMKRTNQSKSRQ